MTQKEFNDFDFEEKKVEINLSDFDDNSDFQEPDDGEYFGKINSIKFGVSQKGNRYCSIKYDLTLDESQEVVFKNKYKSQYIGLDYPFTKGTKIAISNLKKIDKNAWVQSFGEEMKLSSLDDFEKKLGSFVDSLMSKKLSITLKSVPSKEGDRVFQNISISTLEI